MSCHPRPQPYSDPNPNLHLCSTPIRKIPNQLTLTPTSMWCWEWVENLKLKMSPTPIYTCVQLLFWKFQNNRVGYELPTPTLILHQPQPTPVFNNSSKNFELVNIDPNPNLNLTPTPTHACVQLIFKKFQIIWQQPRPQPTPVFNSSSKNSKLVVNAPDPNLNLTPAPT